MTEDHIGKLMRNTAKGCLPFGLVPIALGIVAIWYPGGWICPALGFLGIIPAGYPLLLFAFPKLHPIVRRISRHGDFEALKEEINSEFADSPVRLGLAAITKHWLIIDKAVGFDAMPLENIVLIYPLQQSGRTSGNWVIILGDPRQEVQIPGGLMDVLQMFLQLQQMFPHVLSGYSEARRQLWEEDPSALREYDPGDEEKKRRKRR
jgi:hypothetical protein